MNYFDRLNFVDDEMDELKNSFLKDNYSLEELYSLLIDKEIEKKTSDINKLQSNVGLLYNHPDYQNVVERSTSYELLTCLIDISASPNINDFNNFMRYLGEHKSFKMLENLDSLTYMCFMILSFEGSHSSELSEYSIPYATLLNERIPEYLDSDNYKKYLETFPPDLTVVDSDVINELYGFIWLLEKQNVNTLKDDLSRVYGIDFNIFDDVLNRDTLGLFLRTVKRYNADNKRKVK